MTPSTTRADAHAHSVKIGLTSICRQQTSANTQFLSFPSWEWTQHKPTTQKTNSRGLYQLRRLGRHVLIGEANVRRHTTAGWKWFPPSRFPKARSILTHLRLSASTSEEETQNQNVVCCTPAYLMSFMGVSGMFALEQNKKKSLCENQPNPNEKTQHVEVWLNHEECSCCWGAAFNLWNWAHPGIFKGFLLFLPTRCSVPTLLFSFFSNEAKNVE